ncbi:hypothetical protein CYMTET_3855 [Cymbomonas tetramitiformis]|uniref:Uncharacterized protein n=1 Tax=Cymbomonas tetramitiformis TaxID=36881 RepID=A0AAE0H285_9CHLO|nr:hypothetical protein CYMTET_3855 [Cymbomonas tetramitiformis]
MYNPVTPQALAIVNGEFDLVGILDRKPYHVNNGQHNLYQAESGDNNELFTLTKHDMCFRETRSLLERKRNLCMNDSLLKVFSSFVSLPVWEEGKDYYEEDKVVFVGISQTQMLMDRAKSQSAAVAIATAGKLTIQNTGAYQVRIGDTLCWDFPDESNINKMKSARKRAKYSDGNRVTAAVVPIQKLVENLTKHYKKMSRQVLEEHGGKLSAIYPEIYARKRATDRIIGKATTSAFSDEPAKRSAPASMDSGSSVALDTEKATERGLQRIVRVDRALILLEQFLKSTDMESLRYATSLGPSSTNLDTDE